MCLVDVKPCSISLLLVLFLLVIHCVCRWSQLNSTYLLTYFTFIGGDKAVVVVSAAVESVGETGRPRGAGMRHSDVPGSGEGPVVPQRGGDLYITRLHHLVLGRRVYARYRRGVPRRLGHLPLYDHRQRRTE